MTTAHDYSDPQLGVSLAFKAFCITAIAAASCASMHCSFQAFMAGVSELSGC